MAETKIVKGTGSEPARPSSELGLFGSRSLFGPMIPFGELFGMNPFALMREFTKEMDRTFSPSWGEELAPGAWAPTIEVNQANGNLMIAAELPGIKTEDVKVEVTNDALTIQGERKHEKKEEKEGVYRSERSYGRFYRTIPLPDGSKTDQIKAEMKNGVLEIKIPVTESKEKGRQVPVTTGLETKDQEKKTTAA